LGSADGGPEGRWVMLEGELVRLRAQEPEDLERNLRWINDAEVRQFLLDVRYPISRPEEEKWMETNRGSSFEYVRLAIETKEGQHIGNIGLGPASPVHRRAPLGIMIGGKDCWNRPLGLLGVLDNPALREVAQAAETRLRWVIDRLGRG